MSGHVSAGGTEKSYVVDAVQSLLDSRSINDPAMECEVRTWCSEAGVEQFLTASNRSDIDIAQDVGSAISRILARLDTKKLSPEDKKHHKKIRFAVYQVLVDRYNEGLRSAFRCISRRRTCELVRIYGL